MYTFFKDKKKQKVDRLKNLQLESWVNFLLLLQPLGISHSPWSTDPVGNYLSCACFCGFGTTLRPVKKRDNKIITCIGKELAHLLEYKACTCFRSKNNGSIPLETVIDSINLFNIGYFCTLY